MVSNVKKKVRLVMAHEVDIIYTWKLRSIELAAGANILMGRALNTLGDHV